MTFTPKVWHDLDPTTAWSATAAVDLETRLSGYTDTQVEAEQTRAIAAEATKMAATTSLDSIPAAVSNVNLHGFRLTNVGNPSVGTDALNQAAGDARYDAIGAASTAQAAAQTSSLQKSANLSDLASAATARTNLGLLAAALQDFNVANGAAKLGSDGTVGGVGGSSLNIAAIETAIDSRYEHAANKDVASGYAGLDISGLLKVNELPVSAATANSAVDLLGRTGVLTTTGDPNPATAATVSIMDAPWGAKCDAKVVTDGTIISGTNSLTSATATFAVNQLVVVQGAGPNVQPGAEGPAVPGVLIGFVKTIVGTTVTLVTTKGGSTASNASVTVSGATVKYGTDDTAAIQAAIAAVSQTASLFGAAGTVGLVKFPANRSVILGSVAAKSNVMLWMYGATLHLATTNAVSSTTTMMFTCGTSNVSISNWHLRGGTFPGTGTEAGSSGSQGIMYWQNSGFGQNGTAIYSDISIKDTIVTNWRTGVYDVRGGRRIRISDNSFRSCSWYSGTNTINVIMGGGSSPVDSSDVFIQNNYLDDNGAEGIAIGEATSPTGVFDRAIVTGNIVQITGNVGFGGINAGGTGINVEWSTLTTGQAKEVIVSDNVVRQLANPGGSGNFCIGVGGNISMPANAHYVQRVQVQDNICISTDGGIVVGADDAIISGNIIDYASGVGNTLKGLQVKPGTTLAITADTNSTNSLTNVSVASSGIAENGIQLTGPGIQSGTYLVSGAGTATWTISLPATATATAQALTGWGPTAKRNIVTNNIIHTGTFATGNALWATQLRDSRIAGNIISYEPGNATTGFVGAGMLVQRVGWTDVVDNRVFNAPMYGIKVDSVNDTHVERNRVYNPNQANQASIPGISITNVSGLPFSIRDNRSIDDQAVHLMQRGVDIGATNTLAQLVGNDSRGTTDTTQPFGIMSNYLLVRGNTSDSTSFPAVTTGGAAGASPYTTTALPYPSMISVVGGTVTTIQHNRTGSSTRNLASYGGAAANLTALLAPGDTATITYTVAPTVNVFPQA